MEPVVRSGRVHRVVHAVLLAAGLLAPTGAEGHESRLHDVAVVRERGAVVVKVRMSGRPRYVSTVVAEPPRVVVDFTNTRYAWRSRTQVIGQPPVKEIRGRQVRRGLARLVVDLTQRADVRVEPRPDGLHIVIPAAVASARAASDRATSTAARGASPPDGVVVHPPADRSPPPPGDTAPGAIAAIRADEGSAPAPGREPSPPAPEPREGPSGGAASATGGAPSGPLRLQGIVVVDGVAVAYIEESPARPVRGYRVGDTIADGRIEAISPDTVVIRRPGGEVELKITPPAAAPAKR